MIHTMNFIVYIDDDSYESNPIDFAYMQMMVHH